MAGKTWVGRAAICGIALTLLGGRAQGRPNAGRNGAGANAANNAAGTAAGNAGSGHDTLPTAMSTAHSIYIDNKTSDANLENYAFIELSKWGRFAIADNAEKADLILRLSNGNSVRLVSGDGATAYNPNAVKPAAANDSPVPAGSTRISLVDPKSDAQLWSDVRKTNNAQAAKHMLEGLRQAVEAQGKSRAH